MSVINFDSSTPNKDAVESGIKPVTTPDTDAGVDVPETSSESSVSEIDVTGYMDYNTILAAQKQAQAAGLDTETDGCITGQPAWVLSQPGIAKVVGDNPKKEVWTADGNPSKFVKLIQKKVGLPETGVFDKDVWHFLEVRYGSTIDNWIDDPSETVKLWQTEINAGTFFK